MLPVACGAQAFRQRRAEQRGLQRSAQLSKGETRGGAPFYMYLSPLPTRGGILLIIEAFQGVKATSDTALKTGNMGLSKH